MDALQKVKQLADEILIITSSLKLSRELGQEEADITAYVTMVEKRAPLIEQLNALRSEISEEVTTTEGFADIVETLGEIAKLDEQYQDFMEDVREAVQGAIKKVKQGQKIHQGYQALPPDSTSRRFDIKH